MSEEAEIFEEEEFSPLDEELLDEQLSALNDTKTKDLIGAIKNYLTDEPDTVLEGKIDELFLYFRMLPYEYKSIFLFVFKCNKKENPKLRVLLEELEFIFQKKHIMSIFAEVDSMPKDFQKMWYDNIYIDLAPRYKCLFERYSQSHFLESDSKKIK